VVGSLGHRPRSVDLRRNEHRLSFGVLLVVVQSVRIELIRSVVALHGHVDGIVRRVLEVIWTLEEGRLA